jgi:hypothetical protein
MGRVTAFILITVLPVPVLATTPAEPAKPLPGVSADFSRVPPPSVDGTERGDWAAYPTEQPRVPVNDALRPPQLLWSPTPSSLVKVVPARVRYKLKF